MHELSVCQSIVDQVSRIVADHHASAVEKIHLQLGPLCGVDPDLLRSAFPIARAGSVASHAELIIKSSPIRVRCLVCGAETEASANRLVCAECGNWQTQLLSGNELVLERIEMHKQH